MPPTVASAEISGKVLGAVGLLLNRDAYMYTNKFDCLLTT